jgi:hypothetical protein
LLHFSPGENAPHRAFIYLTFEGDVAAQYDPSMDADVLSDDLAHDRMLRYEVSPYLSKGQMTRLIQDKEFIALVVNILEGWSIDPATQRGMLTVEALDADTRLGILCSNIRALEGAV